MKDRILTTFSRLRAEKRAALIPFIMGYDPDAKTTSALLDALPGAGADVIEIGMPFSDPMADGPVIQAAGKRALEAGATVAGVLELVREFRKAHQDTPIILMGYFNPIYRYGNERFCKAAAKVGVDGVIIVDLPPEEEQELKLHLDTAGIHFIRLIAPTSGDIRLPSLVSSASGFVYYISVAGITGVKSANFIALKKQVKHLREFTRLPIAVGFGIKTPEDARQVAGFADAVVVGSALVSVISKAKGKPAKVKAAAAFMAKLKKAL